MAQDLTKELNGYLANLNIMKANVLNMHWNAVGPYFVAIHLITEKIYKKLSAQVDEVAEIMKMRHMEPLVKLSDYVDEATIDELDAQEFNESDILEYFIEDGQELVAQAKGIREKASKIDDFLIANKFEEYLSCYAKMEWMLRAMNLDDANIEKDED